MNEADKCNKGCRRVVATPDDRKTKTKNPHAPFRTCCRGLLRCDIPASAVCCVCHSAVSNTRMIFSSVVLRHWRRLTVDQWLDAQRCSSVACYSGRAVTMLLGGDRSGVTSTLQPTLLSVCGGKTMIRSPNCSSTRNWSGLSWIECRFVDVSASLQCGLGHAEVFTSVCVCVGDIFTLKACRFWQSKRSKTVVSETNQKNKNKKKKNTHTHTHKKKRKKKRRTRKVHAYVDKSRRDGHRLCKTTSFTMTSVPCLLRKVLQCAIDIRVALNTLTEQWKLL